MPQRSKINKEMVIDKKWIRLLRGLADGSVPSHEIGPTIVKLGKPFDEDRIHAAKDVVAKYLVHRDPWVRREAMWFLTSWGGLLEFMPALFQVLRNDEDVDNRSYAATCLGELKKGSNDYEAILALKNALEDKGEDELVRKYAYRSLLQVVPGDMEDFSPHEGNLSDVNWAWVRSLPHPVRHGPATRE